jgi:hypothetical protein
MLQVGGIMICCLPPAILNTCRLQFFNTSRVKNLCLVLLDLEEAERALKAEHARREQQDLKLVLSLWPPTILPESLMLLRPLPRA